MSGSVLERIGDTGFSCVKRVWAGEPVVCIGGGTSLTRGQVDLVRGRAHVIAVNDAYLWAPFAELNFFADSEWWSWHSKGDSRVAKPLLGLTASQVRERFHAFKGERCSIQYAGADVSDPAVHKLRKASEEGFSTDPTRIVTGRNSGFMALNIAVLAGAAPIILLGYDAREPGPGELSHWHGGHPRKEPIHVYASHRRSFTQAELALKAAGARVINCSPGSAIDSFERMPLEEALECRALSA